MHFRFLCLPALLAALLFGTAGCADPGTKPYRDLTASEIQFATVTLAPPDETLPIEDLETLAELLRDLTIYEQDDSYTEYAGQAAIFALTMADGTRTTVTAYSPFLIIDETAYQAEHAPCEALNRYANQLLDTVPAS